MEQSGSEATPEDLGGGSKPSEGWEDSQDPGVSPGELLLPTASWVVGISVLGYWL